MERLKVLKRSEVIELLKEGRKIHCSMWGGLNSTIQTDIGFQSIRCETIYWLLGKGYAKKINTHPLHYSVIATEKIKEL